MRLNLGAADRRIEGFISVDIASPADELVDLAGPWLWADSSVDEVMALDVCEHIGDCPHIESTFGAKCSHCAWSLDAINRHPLGRIHFMNELHRVLKPGARATIETPNAAKGAGYFQDPTHVSPWCMSTFKYFEHGSFAHTRLSNAYGITAAFKIVDMKELGPMPGEGFGELVYKIRCVLEAVK